MLDLNSRVMSGCTVRLRPREGAEKNGKCQALGIAVIQAHWSWRVIMETEKWMDSIDTWRYNLKLD